MLRQVTGLDIGWSTRLPWWGLAQRLEKKPKTLLLAVAGFPWLILIEVNEKTVTYWAGMRSASFLNLAWPPCSEPQPPTPPAALTLCRGAAGASGAVGASCATRPPPHPLRRRFPSWAILFWGCSLSFSLPSEIQTWAFKGWAFVSFLRGRELVCLIICLCYSIISQRAN